MGEKFPGHDPGHETNNEMGLSAEALSARLGFLETEELRHIRARLTEAMIAGNQETIKNLVADYHDTGRQIVNEWQGDEYGRATIGMLLAIALARRDAGKIEDYHKDLDDALDYATNVGYDDVAEALQKVRDEEV